LTALALPEAFEVSAWITPQNIDCIASHSFSNFREAHDQLSARQRRHNSAVDAENPRIHDRSYRQRIEADDDSFVDLRQKARAAFAAEAVKIGHRRELVIATKQENVLWEKDLQNVQQDNDFA
jgi:hypothetical protein